MKPAPRLTFVTDSKRSTAVSQRHDADGSRHFIRFPLHYKWKGIIMNTNIDSGYNYVVYRVEKRLPANQIVASGNHKSRNFPGLCRTTVSIDRQRPPSQMAARRIGRAEWVRSVQNMSNLFSIISVNPNLDRLRELYNNASM
jgi:hypothetical protein